jgi:hypothetical protein
VKRAASDGALRSPNTAYGSVASIALRLILYDA